MDYFLAGSIFSITNTASDHSSISIITELDFNPQDSNIYIEYSIFTKLHHVDDLLRLQQPERRRPSQLRTLQPSSRQHQSLLRIWRHLSRQWALRDAVWSIL